MYEQRPDPVFTPQHRNGIDIHMLNLFFAERIFHCTGIHGRFSHRILVELAQFCRFIGLAGERIQPFLHRNKRTFRPFAVMEQLAERFVDMLHDAFCIDELDSLIDIVDDILVQLAPVFDFFIHHDPLNGQRHPADKALNFADLFFGKRMADPAAAEYCQNLIIPAHDGSIVIVAIDFIR
ncbi:hypothetical protein D3C75_741610 [compost metagenome]